MAKLFVYGTLKRKFHAHSLIKEAPAAFLREATTSENYHLYDVGSFPGLAEDSEIEGTGVKGELYEISDSAFSGLDRYECVSTGLFRRGTVVLEDGSEAYAYFFNRGFEGSIRIESGTWE